MAAHGRRRASCAGHYGDTRSTKSRPGITQLRWPFFILWRGPLEEPSCCLPVASFGSSCRTRRQGERLGPTAAQRRAQCRAREVQLHPQRHVCPWAARETVCRRMGIGRGDRSVAVQCSKHPVSPCDGTGRDERSSGGKDHLRRASRTSRRGERQRAAMVAVGLGRSSGPRTARLLGACFASLGS